MSKMLTNSPTPNRRSNSARHQAEIRSCELADTLEDLSLKILGRNGKVENDERLNLVDELRATYSVYMKTAPYASPERQRITELYQRANTDFE